MAQMRCVIFTLLSTCMLSACAVGPDYHAPAVGVPLHWHSQTPPTAMPAMLPPEPWWMTFDDATLDGLIKRALSGNQDRKMAEARILEARASRQSTASALYPQVQGTGQASRSNEGFSTFGKDMNLYDGEFDASYELDLFGGNRRRVEAQDAAIAASEADYRDITITLTAEVARGYVEWRQLQQQLKLTRATIAAQQQLFDITQAHYRVGLASQFEVSQAETLYKDTASRLPEIERQLQASGYALSVLLGEVPGKLNDELKPEQLLPAVPSTLSALDAPTAVITRRPDVERAEKELAAATAQQGVAISELYPTISLSALFGIQDTHLTGGMFGLPLGVHGSIWSLGSGLTMPLLNFGRIEGQIKATDARQVQAFHAYRQAVLQALADVETSLTNLAKENERRQALQAAADSAARTLSMAIDRHKQGLSDFTDVLQAEQQLYAAQSSLIASQTNVVKDIIALYKALGE